MIKVRAHKRKIDGNYTSPKDGIYANWLGGKIKITDGKFQILTGAKTWLTVPNSDVDEYLADYNSVNVINRPAIWFILYYLRKGKDYGDIKTIRVEY